MGRADGARAWARVLSELAGVPVTVEWERPAWRVYWTDGPTRRVLMDRAAALGRYRVGAPLGFERLRFVRSSSAAAVALGWLARGSPESPAEAGEARAVVEAWCEDTGYPETRFDERGLAAADLLRRLARGDGAEMGALLAAAVPAVPPHVMAGPGPELTGRVTSSRWPVGGPPADLLGPAPQRPAGRPERAHRRRSASTAANHCRRSGRGRPARFCSGRCRVAAHRAQHRAQIRTPPEPAPSGQMAALPTSDNPAVMRASSALT